MFQATTGSSQGAQPSAEDSLPRRPEPASTVVAESPEPEPFDGVAGSCGPVALARTAVGPFVKLV
jgi:hypothetical protein